MDVGDTIAITCGVTGTIYRYVSDVGLIVEEEREGKEGEGSEEGEGSGETEWYRGGRGEIVEVVESI